MVDLNKIQEAEEHFVCPRCNALTTNYAPYFKNMFDNTAYGYFITCEGCKKTSFLQIIYNI